MKKQILLALALLLNSLMFAQGGGFNYKALITNGGSALSNQAVNIKFTVLENGATNVYQETQSATTDANGIVSVIVGEGNTVSGNFTTIDWANNPYFLKVEIDSGSGYQDFGTNELKAVPYAKFAEKAGNTFSGSFNDLTNVPSGLADGDDVNDADHSTTNELQNLSVNGTQLTISNGNAVTLPDQTDADFYKEGTTTQPTNINDDIYTMGNVAIGKNTADYPLDIVSNTSYRGVNVELSTGGSGIYFGVHNELSGTGTGIRSGVHSVISNSGNGFHYGSFSALNGSGSGFHYGNYNNLSGSGTGKQYGVYTNISNSGNVEHYGSYSYLIGSGSGLHYGNYNKLSGSGTGRQYGVYNNITNSGDATHFGSYSKLSGSGSGNKYATYNVIPTTAGGTHYAVYGEAEKSGSYAGYFKGDVVITGSIQGKIKADDSGDTDMKAYIYGAINFAGGFGAGAHSDGFTVLKIGTGHYKITFTNSPGNTHAYTVMTNMRFNAIGFITVKNYASYFEIKTYNTSGNPANKGFNFVVYKK